MNTRMNTDVLFYHQVSSARAGWADKPRGQC